MSTWQLLELWYPQASICPGRMWDDIIQIPLDQLAQYVPAGVVLLIPERRPREVVS